MLRKAVSNSKPPIFHKPQDPETKKGKDSGHTQIPWSQYFDVEKQIAIPDTENVFQVYISPATPLPGPVFVLLHGCGLSAMSWALVAGEVKKEYNVVAYDFRGHGNSSSVDDNDLSGDTLANDTIQLLNIMYGADPTTSIILVGHSMGGAIATRVASSGKVKGIVGLAVVDVVEGTALAAMGGMQGIIAGRPSSFSSISKGIEWAISSDTVRNLESARASIPAQLIQVGGEEGGRWVWRTDLARTEVHWKGWFTNLSQAFLGARAARLLLLAGTDRLDRELIMGQMQGKFQLTVLPAVGHLVQEDSPSATAAALISFANRNQFGKPLVFPPKPFPVGPKPKVT